MGQVGSYIKNDQDLKELRETDYIEFLKSLAKLYKRGMFEHEN